MLIDKWDAEEIANDESLIRSVEEYHSIRHCSFCGKYVRVEEFSSEKIMKDGTYEEDICDDCVEKLENGEEISYCDEEYEDFLDEQIEEDGDDY